LGIGGLGRFSYYKRKKVMLALVVLGGDLRWSWGLKWGVLGVK
jgi:hypothetical protein